MKQKTVNIYDREILRFIRNFTASYGIPPLSAGIIAIQEYVDFCYPVMISGRSAFRVHFAAIRFWLSLNRPSERNALVFPQIRIARLRILTLPELKGLFDYTRSHPCGIMLRMIYECGIRLKEITRIRIADLDYEEMKIRLRNSDDLPSRNTALPEELKYDLMRLSNMRDPSGYLFSLRERRNGVPQPVSIRTLQQFLNRVSTELGMAGLRIQTLRDSYAVHMLERGYDPDLITRVMGFKNVRSVRRLRLYISKPSIFPQSPLREFSETIRRDAGKENTASGGMRRRI